MIIRSYGRVIGSPRYFPVWLGQLVSGLGDTINYVALIVDVYKLTGSGVALSTLVVLQVVPVILGGIIAGPVIDRYSRKCVLIAADLARAGLIVGLIAAETLWQVYVLAFGTAMASTFFSPALTASIPSLVDGDDLVAANAVSWSAAQLVQVIGSAVAGGIIGLLGVSAAFGFNAVTFLVSAVSISIVTFPPESSGGTRSPHFRALRDGLAYVRTDPFVSRVFLVQLLASLAVGGTSALLVVLAERRYHLPPAGFASFLIAIAFGALVGPLMFGSIIRKASSLRLVFLPYVIRGATEILLGLHSLPILGQLLLFVYGLNTSTGMVTYQSAMQARVPDRLRGRVFTLMDVSWNGARIMSVVGAGVIADRFGIAVVYYVGGLLLVVAGFIGLSSTRRLP